MAVRVRLFAALRDAAGTAEEAVDSAPLRAVLDELCRRHGELFAQRLAISTVLLDGSACGHDAELVVPDGAELALLPPVSGGASSPAATHRR
jgi:molybdopterin converting factor small subunit